MGVCDLMVGRDAAYLSALIKQADADNAQCRARIARNEQIRAACQIALIRQQIEEAEQE